eukprot:scaffold652104_cov34-Prasinocladus_malaysianus.AAC.1
MTGLASLWGARLTYNFYIKGGYSGGEDYRWQEVRKWFLGWQYEAFNALFICTFQQVQFTQLSISILLIYPSGWRL